VPLSSSVINIKGNTPCHCGEMDPVQLRCSDAANPGPGALSIFVELDPAFNNPPLRPGDYNISVSLFGAGILV
jgi:hypothetical protein